MFVVIEYFVLLDKNKPLLYATTRVLSIFTFEKIICIVIIEHVSMVN
jgi:hypothetical protein